MVVHRAGINHQPPEALSKRHPEGTDRTSLNNELTVLIMNETKKREDVEMKCSHQDQPDDKRTSSHRDTNCKKTTTLRELLVTHGDDRTCTQEALIIGFPRSMFTFDNNSALLQVSSIDGASQRYIPATL